jgi:hypothetical protein
MKIFYRISDVPQDKTKDKPSYINNENCLRNFTKVFNKHIHGINVIADNVCDATYDMICKYVPESNIQKVSEGNGAATFRLAFNTALQYEDNEIIYFVENDYIHKPNSDLILLEGFSLEFAYVTLYDHPDKYISRYAENSNPLNVDCSEVTRVYASGSSHWKITNSTTMTFAAKVHTLKTDEAIIRKWTKGIHPHDFFMFLEIQDPYFMINENALFPTQAGKRRIISPIPAYSTHGDSDRLSPLVNWEKYAAS